MYPVALARVIPDSPHKSDGRLARTQRRAPLVTSGHSFLGFLILAWQTNSQNRPMSEHKYLGACQLGNDVPSNE